MNIDSESDVQMATNPDKSGGMFDGASHLIFGMAKDLRKNMSNAEKVLWFHLRQNPEAFKFRRQHP